MTAVLLTPPVTRWCCGLCTATDVTREAKVHTRMHNCAGLAGLLVPMVQEGQRVKIEAVEREDYIGNERVQFDGNGRPIMSAVITRDDGQDAVVYAPHATAHGRT